MRLQYPPSLRIIEVPCSGKVDIVHLLLAFEQGADGVMVVGCLEGDCHYSAGNLYAKKRVFRVKDILEKVGLGGERIGMFNLSSGMGGRFAEVVREMTGKIMELGPSPIRTVRATAARPAAEVTAS